MDLQRLVIFWEIIKMEEFLKRSKPSSSNNVVELSDGDDLASSKHDGDDDNEFEPDSKR